MTINVNGGNRGRGDQSEPADNAGFAGSVGKVFMNEVEV